MRHIAALLFLGFLWNSCVEEYKVSKEITENYESSLVIQGQIYQETTPLFI